MFLRTASVSTFCRYHHLNRARFLPIFSSVCNWANWAKLALNFFWNIFKAIWLTEYNNINWNDTWYMVVWHGWRMKFILPFSLQQADLSFSQPPAQFSQQVCISLDSPCRLPCTRDSCWFCVCIWSKWGAHWSIWRWECLQSQGTQGTLG